MKQFTKRKLPALVLAICLILPNVTTAFAGAPQVQAPSLVSIDTEITATAEYLKTSAIIDAKSDFYNSSKLLILLLRSGINCSTLVDSYLSQVSSAYISNGTLTLTDPLTDYAYLSIILALSGKDATNFNGFNLIQKFETAISTADQTTLNYINPYKLPHLYAAAYAYTKDLKDSATCLAKIKIAILSYENANGIDYWGNSSDNNGFVLSGLSILSVSDSNIKRLVDNALVFSQTLLQSDGTSNGDFQWSPFPNSNSTAASLTLYSTYGMNDLAAKSYAGLLTYKTSSKPGAYSFTNAADAESSYSTIDAFYGLVSYRAVLANQSAPFNIADKLASISITKPELETVGIISTGLTIDDSATINSSLTSDSGIDINPKSPSTGDTNIMAIFFILSFISVGGVFAITYLQVMQVKRKDA